MTTPHCRDCPETDPSKFGKKTNRCLSCNATYNRSNQSHISARALEGMMIRPMQHTEFDDDIEANRVEILIR